MALALVLAAHQHCCGASGFEADLRILHARCTGSLYRVGNAQAPQLAARRGFLASFGKAGVVAKHQRIVEAFVEVAAVVSEGERRFVGERRGRQHVPATQLHPVDAKCRGCFVHDPFDHVDRLGAAGAAIGAGGVGVGEDTAHPHMGGAKTVHPDQGPDVGEGRQQLPVRGYVGPDVAEGTDTQCEEFSARVQREFGFAHAIAAVLVGQQGFAAVAGPLDRTAEFSRQPKYEAVLGIGPALAAERTPHVS